MKLPHAARQLYGLFCHTIGSLPVAQPSHLTRHKERLPLTLHPPRSTRHPQLFTTAPPADHH
jgi:hypothetical protein